MVVLQTSEALNLIEKIFEGITSLEDFSEDAPEETGEAQHIGGYEAPRFHIGSDPMLLFNLSYK